MSGQTFNEIPRTIEIRQGFLRLTGLGRLSNPPDRSGWLWTLYIKGSAITAIEPADRAGPDGKTATYIAGSVATILVAESVEEILQAVEDSYKQAARR